MNRRDCLKAGLALGMIEAMRTGRRSSASPADDFRPLFNGKDLEGWVPINVAPETFTVRDGMIVSTGQPTGMLRTDRPYENFVLELEWRHIKPGGNAGLFIWSDALPAVGTPFTRGVEVQILDGQETPNYTSHGDVFPVHGATFEPDRPHPGGWMRCLPSERRAKPSPEWNHYGLVCLDGRIALSVNGKEVSGGNHCRPRMGFICLESEGSECHFRNIRIRELTPSHPVGDEVADIETGWAPIFTGLDLRGWKENPGHKGHWRAEGNRILYDGRSESADPNLWTVADFGDFEMVVDWRLPGEPKPRPRPLILPSGDDAVGDDGKVKTLEIPYAGDSGILLRGSEKAQINITCNTVGSGELYGYRTDKAMPPDVRSAAVPREKADKPPGQWNRFRLRLEGKKLTVFLNGRLVIDRAVLPDLPDRGPIGLQHHGDPLEFMNLFVRPLG